MFGSILTVHVVEARDLKPMDMDGTSDPYVVLQIEDQRIETNYKKSTLQPVWNESFTFEITHGREPLQIVVMDKDTFGNDDLEGICQFPLNQLRDQMKHDQWLDLVDEKGQPTQGRVRLMLQWVYSKVDYFKDYLEKWDVTLENDISEKDQIEKFIKQLESPFGFLENAAEAFQTENDNDDPTSQPQNALEAIVKINDKSLKDKEHQWE